MPRASPLPAPATRDQADAYRFGLRRMEAALVRGDPVPEHEQVRTQRRATFAGVLLGLLALCVVAVYAMVVPKPDWRRQAIVIGSGSGSMYVVARDPDRLVPVANLPAARLVIAALRSGGASSAEPATSTPVAVPDDTLAGARRTATAAVPGAAAVELRAVPAPRWGICDEVTDEGRLISTAVIGGAGETSPPPAQDGVLVEGPDETTWLLTAGRRHRIDAGDGRVLAAFGLARMVPRAVAAGLLSALPEGPVLRTPEVPGRGRPAPGGLPGRIGDVLVVLPAGGPATYYAVLRDGLQQVPGVVAELLRVVSGEPDPRPVGSEVVAAAPVADQLAVAGWPAVAPRMVEPAEAPVLCWTWTAGGPAPGDMWFGTVLPVPPGTVPTALAQADGAGPRVDEVAVGPGGAVRSVGVGTAPGAGPLWIVSSTGVGYGVTDDATATALGITRSEAAPEAALRLLPTGPALDLADATRILDVTPSGSG